MKLYPDTEKELFFSDYKPLPALRGLPAAELRELYDNLTDAADNAFVNGSELLEMAVTMDARKVKNYLHFAERRESKQ